MISNKSSKSNTIVGLVTVNEKGQVVIPAEAREAIDLKPGDKLMVMAHPDHHGVTLVKPDQLEQFINNMLEQLSTARSIGSKEK